MKNRYLLFVITLALLIGICGSASAYTVDVFGSNDLGDPVRTGHTYNPSQSVTVRVLTGPNIPSQSFMLGLYGGTPPAFHARGFVNPDGTSSNDHFDRKDLSYNSSGPFYIGSLVAQVGSSYYNIGYGGTFTPTTSGELKLLMWGLPSGSPSDLTGHTIFAETHCGGVTADVSATPIPGAAWLLGSGIIGLIGLKRKKSKKA